MWSTAIAAEPVRAILERATPLRQSTIRLWRTLEADLAASLRGLEKRVPRLEITTCMRTGELEIVTRYQPQAQGCLLYTSRCV